MPRKQGVRGLIFLIGAINWTARGAVNASLARVGTGVERSQPPEMFVAGQGIFQSTTNFAAKPRLRKPESTARNVAQKWLNHYRSKIPGWGVDNDSRGGGAGRGKGAMAERGKKKAAPPARKSKKNSSAAKSQTAHKQSAPETSQMSRKRLEKIERERDDALSRLAVAEQRIQDLESCQEQVINRIDWLIDSLHNMK